jgi:hypothetical protein
MAVAENSFARAGPGFEEPQEERWRVEFLLRSTFRRLAANEPIETRSTQSDRCSPRVRYHLADRTSLHSLLVLFLQL